MASAQADTIASAHAVFDEREMESIAQGKVADLAVWQGDLRHVSEDNVAEQKVVATYVGGRRVWQA